VVHRFYRKLREIDLCVGKGAIECAVDVAGGGSTC